MRQKTAYRDTHAAKVTDVVVDESFTDANITGFANLDFMGFK